MYSIYWEHSSTNAFNYRVHLDYASILHIKKNIYSIAFLKAGQFWFPKHMDLQGCVVKSRTFSVFLCL